MFGPYTAELHATYGTNNNLTLFASAGFFIFPWKIVGVVVLAIVVLVLLFIFWRRKRKNTPLASQPVQQAPPQPQMPTA
jgi:hypothetical protein